MMEFPPILILLIWRQKLFCNMILHQITNFLPTCYIPHSITLVQVLSGFDQPVGHPMLQRMHVPGNLPPLLLQGMSKGPRSPHAIQGVALPAHSNSQVAGFMQDMNPVPRLPFGHRQPNLGSSECHSQLLTLGGGSNHPEALQRLIEMELRPMLNRFTPLLLVESGDVCS